MSEIRVRFAPSPTGFLHIGGVRTALYNYLLAKKYNGTFILRIEDTDQKRYVEGAEDYIRHSLSWLGINIDEGVEAGGDYGPYRQSERTELYQAHVQKLIDRGLAYYAFDTAEELEAMRERKQKEGIHTPKYDHTLRDEMKNSIALSDKETQELLERGVDYVVRMLIPADETITFSDKIRGEVSFETSELDDKVILKADGLPTYHLANVVDDYHMKISHVIRGEEWLSSTAHHVLLYRFFEWDDNMPAFAHLPLILKPSGKGKLSKRDGAKLDFPVFPLTCTDPKTGDVYKGFDEYGFNTQAVVNFLAFLGWNPGTEQEIFSMEELIEAFSIDHISKSGSRFDYDKALWFNQQYILNEDIDNLVSHVKPLLQKAGYDTEATSVKDYVSLMRARCHTYDDFVSQGDYMFSDISDFDTKQIRKKYKAESPEILKAIKTKLETLGEWNSELISEQIKGFIAEEELSFGKVLPILRLATAGTMQGPDIFKMLELIGREKTSNRIAYAIEHFPLNAS